MHPGQSDGGGGHADLLRLDAISEPQLNFPAALNRDVAPMLQYAGATVNAQHTSIYPPLLDSLTRY